MKQLGYTDSIFINLETASTPQHVAFLGIYDPSSAKNGIVRFKDVIANFERRLHALPHFRTRLVQVPGRLDLPYWIVDDEFDVEYHIRHLALPHPGDWRQLCIQAARLHARSMDMNRPMWECYVIEGLDHVEGCAAGSFAIYLKFHHSLVDGDLGQQIMTAIHDLEPYPAAPATPEEKSGSAEADAFKAPRLGDAELVARAMANRMLRLVPTARNAAKLTRRLGGTALRIARKELPMPKLGPKTRFDQPVGPHRVFDGIVLPLDQIKAIKNASGSTINDVCMAIVSGGLRSYLQHHGELPEQSVVVNVPVNMRARGVESEENNQIAALMPELCTNVADPLERLRAIQDSMSDAKKFIGTPIAEPLKIVGLLPPFLAKPLSRSYAYSKLTRYLPAGTPCVVTNVPGPPVELYANAAKLVRMHCLGLLTPGVGLFNAIFSHDDKLTISILGDRDLMPDPAFYAECLQLAYEELRDAVLETPTQDKTKRGKPAVRKTAKPPARKRAAGTRAKKDASARAKPA